MLTAALFTVAEIRTQHKRPSIYSSRDTDTTQVSIDGCMCKEDAMHTHTHTHTHNGIRLSHKKKKNETMPFGAMWMDLEMTMPSEVRQKEKGKYHDITHTWNGKKKGTNELIGKTDSKT